MGMIYRQSSMGKKRGDLGPVWMAAHFPQRLKKGVVEETNISSSVDKILVDQLPVVTYRILSFLLLGVVRIYSKKVEYLHLDCNSILHQMNWRRKKNDINVGGMCSPESSSRRSHPNVVDMCVAESSSRMRCNSFVEALRAQFSSISLPQNFELDAFDLELVEDENSEDHVKSHLELVLNDEWENDGTGHQTFGKGLMEVSTGFEDHASAYDMITNINPSNSETSAEKLRDWLSHEECRDPMVLGDTDEETGFAASPPVEQEPGWKNHMFSDNDMIMEDGEHPDKEEHLDEECTTRETTISETTLVEITLKPSPDKHRLSVTINETPQTKASVVPGEHKSDFAPVRTPASKERVKAARKGKLVYDDVIMVDNDVYKDWIADPSDLVGKRMKAPTTLLAWKKRRFSDLPRSFLEPIIPINAGSSSDPISVIAIDNSLPLETVDDMMEAASKNDGPGSVDMHKAPEQEAETIAPSTPLTKSTSLRFSEIHKTSKANEVEPTSSSESKEKDLFPSRDLVLDEVPCFWEEDNTQENGLVAEKWSTVTKSVAGYLHSNFVRRKERGEEEAVNLSKILKQKTKKESARFFSELLVLKTGGYVDVKQEKAYDEIYVMQTSKLKEALEAEAGGNRCSPE